MTVMPGLCSLCGYTRNRNGRYCRDCHNAYMREWRKTHPQSEEEKFKSRCRAYTNVLIKRGQLTKQPCLRCGAADVEAHHTDYLLPRVVMWLCRTHHRAEHDRIYDQRLGRSPRETNPDPQPEVETPKPGSKGRIGWSGPT